MTAEQTKIEIEQAKNQTVENGAPETTDRLFVTRLRLVNWKNFKQMDVQLQRRAFVVGPNGSGKSNFLDALRFVHDVAADGLLDAVRGARGGVSRIRSLYARREPGITVHVELGSIEKEKIWSYELAFDEDEKGRPIIKKEEILHHGKRLRSRPTPSDEKDPERLTQTIVQQVSENKEFRPMVQFLQSFRYLHIVPQVVRQPERWTSKPNDPYGGDFLRQVANSASTSQRDRLGRIEEALKAAVPQLKDLRLRTDKAGAPHLEGRFMHWRPEGAFQREDQFSDGTLRLLGLLWTLQEDAGVLLMEEPELSLHSELVSFLPQLFARVQEERGLQIIVSTHSIDILKDSGIGLDETVLLVPGEEGTKTVLASSLDDAETLLKHGSTMADIVMARTRPKEASKITLVDFGG